MVSEMICAVVPSSFEISNNLSSMMRHRRCLKRSLRVVCLDCNRLLGLYLEPNFFGALSGEEFHRLR